MPAKPESVSQGITKQRAHLLQGQSRDPIAETPDLPPRQAARHHGLKSGQITGHVQSQTVLGDPASTADPDRRHFALIQPHPCEPIDALTLKIKDLQHIQYHLLELTQIPMQIGLMATEIQNRISHQLTRGVMGHLAAPVDAVQRCRRLKRIKWRHCRHLAERCINWGAAAARRLRHHRGSRLRQQACLPKPLSLPGLLEGNKLLRLEKKCRRPISGIRRRL